MAWEPRGSIRELIPKPPPGKASAVCGRPGAQGEAQREHQVRLGWEPEPVVHLCISAWGPKFVSQTRAAEAGESSGPGSLLADLGEGWGNGTGQGPRSSWLVLQTTAYSRVGSKRWTGSSWETGGS